MFGRRTALMTFDHIYLVRDARMPLCLGPLLFPSCAISLVCFETKPVNAIKDINKVLSLFIKRTQEVERFKIMSSKVFIVSFVSKNLLVVVPFFRKKTKRERLCPILK